jgi:peptidoglycan/xylan/chitin deacetylase (PgdA/CDA1 family)
LIRRQDLTVLLFYYLGFSRIRNLIFHFQHKAVANVLIFHDIVDKEIVSFEKKMHFLKQNTNVVSVDDFFSGKLSQEKINTVITFDDGFRSWLCGVIPILQKLKLSATFFISSGFLNLSREKQTEFIRTKLLANQRTLSRDTCGLRDEDVKRIVEEGFIVGGHTLNHYNLANLIDRDILKYEIAEDKARLEHITGRRVEYFAYPFGAYHNPIINITEVLKQVGYRGAMTTVPGLNKFGSDPFMLNREPTPVSIHEQVFRARSLGNYEAVLFLKKVLLK